MSQSCNVIAVETDANFGVDVNVGYRSCILVGAVGQPNSQGKDGGLTVSFLKDCDNDWDILTKV